MKYTGVANEMNILDSIGIYRGEFKRIEIDVTDETDENIPLDSITVNFKVCDVQDEDIIYIEKTGENSPTKRGVSSIRLNSSDTESIPVSKYQYVIEVVYETGNKSIGKGYLTIL